MPFQGYRGTLNQFSVETVVRSRDRIAVPKIVPWFSYSELIPTGTFNCAEQDPAPIVGQRYLVFIYEVGGDYSAVRGSSATAAMAIDDRDVLHSIADTVDNGQRKAFGASRELDGLALDDASRLLAGMTQGADPLEQVRADTATEPSPPSTAKSSSKGASADPTVAPELNSSPTTKPTS